VAVSGSADADGVVTRRDADGRFAFVETRVGLEVQIEPPLEGAELSKLLDSAEYGCFIGASLTAKPNYEWRVNGETVAR
jgi:organic hydroperoxide reductase OsmC/OhrA